MKKNLMIFFALLSISFFGIDLIAGKKKKGKQREKTEKNNDGFEWLKNNETKFNFLN